MYPKNNATNDIYSLTITNLGTKYGYHLSDSRQVGSSTYSLFGVEYEIKTVYYSWKKAFQTYVHEIVAEENGRKVTRNSTFVYQHHVARYTYNHLKTAHDIGRLVGQSIICNALETHYYAIWSDVDAELFNVDISNSLNNLEDFLSNNLINY